MSEPLGERLTKDVDPRAIDEVWHRIEAPRGRPVSAKWGVFGLLAAAAITVAVLLVVRGRFSSAPLAPVAGAPTPAALRLANGEALGEGGADTFGAREVVLDDGSRLSIAEGTRLDTVENTGRAVSFVMGLGATTFDVAPNGPRAWKVDAGLCTVLVLGTRFRVSRETHRARVDVERGRVRVTSPRIEGGETIVTAGRSVEVHDDDPADSPSPSASTPGPASPAAVPAWHPLAKKGDYGAAYQALGQEGVARETRRATTAADLLQLADVARLSGHPREAVSPLDRILAEHGREPSAPQAAFTLGKLQLDALGNPSAGAAAFEKAISLGLPAALREDAFARRVEAYARAGNAPRARAARAAYDEAFPNGRHRAALAKLAP